MRLYDFRWEPSILSQSLSDLKVAVIGTGHTWKYNCTNFIGRISLWCCCIWSLSKWGYQVICDKSILQEAISDADIVTIHIPATKYNHHLFDDNVFKSFKSGVIFVNCARGRLVDTKALLSAIDQRGKNINDPYLDALIERDDAIFTPHIAFIQKWQFEN